MSQNAYEVPYVTWQHCMPAVTDELAQVAVANAAPSTSGGSSVVYGDDLHDHWPHTAIENVGYQAR